MKIGILTFHCAHNYGAVLQCYALQETLKSMGHDVEVIDYRPQCLIKPYEVFNIKWFIRKNIFKSFIRIIIEIFLYRKRRKRFQNFNSFINKELNLSVKVIDYTLPDKYDVYIVGSDQVWNKKITWGMDPIYWGNFKRLSNQKLVTYAASMETSNIEDNVKPIIRKYLKNFDAISVREINLKNLLLNLYDKDIDLVLDPTLLASSSIWENIIEKPKINGKYVFIYQYGSDKNVIRIAKRIATQIGAKVLNLNNDVLKIGNDNSLFDTSPYQFLGYIKYASFVITPTFHGTAFSVILKKPFYNVKFNSIENTRVGSLLKDLNLIDRIVLEDSSPDYSEIDYNKVDSMLNSMQIKSINYLHKIGL